MVLDPCGGLLGPNWADSELNACLASEDNNVVDGSSRLVRQKLADDEAANLASTNDSEILVSRHI